MTARTYTNPISIIIAGQMANLTSPESRQLLALGRTRGWGCSVLGKAPMPDNPVRVGDWLLVPAQHDSSPIPERAFRRIQTIYAAGLRPRGFILAHEAPKLLKAPSSAPTSRDDKPGVLQLPAISPQVKSALKTLAVVLGAIALGIIAVAGAIILAIALVAAAMALLVPIAMVGTLVLIDPILVAVTEDGYWIEIDRWDV